MPSHLLTLMQECQNTCRLGEMKPNFTLMLLGYAIASPNLHYSYFFANLPTRIEIEFRNPKVTRNRVTNFDRQVYHEQAVEHLNYLLKIKNQSILISGLSSL
jgi:hypothetical protein